MARAQSDHAQVPAQENHSPNGTFTRVTPKKFRACIMELTEKHERYRRNVTLHPSYLLYDCWLLDNGRAGFAVSPDRELVNVFSRQAGLGDALMKFALSRYTGLHLNCFAGALEKFYGRYDFEVVRRVPNWTPGHADVVFMRHAPAPKPKAG